MNTLVIDTSSNKVIKVAILVDGKEHTLQQEASRKTQVVLPMIAELLKEHKLSFASLHGIEVNVGPGSFTGLRIGVSIANTLGLILQIPINGQAVGKTVEAVYS